MEDYLFTVEVNFVDSSTGEVLAKPSFHKPLSLLEDEDINKYLHSFIRGIRQGKDVVLIISVCRDRDLPKVQQLNLF